MKRLKTIGLAVLLACAGCSIKVTGEYDPELPGHFIASTQLQQDEKYLIRNNTDGLIYLWLLDDRSPIQYFLLFPGDVREFVSPGNEFDLYNASGNGVSLWWIPN